MPMFEIEANGKRYQVEAPDAGAATRAVHGMQQPAYSGSFLPFSKDQQGNVSFDSNAGIFGTVKRAFTLPGEVYQGKVDPLSDEGIARSLEMGTVFGPMNPAVRSGDYPIPGNKRAIAPPRKPPTAEELKAAGSAGFDRLRDLGVDYSSNAVRDMAAGLRADLQRDGILPELAPKAYKILDALENPPPDSVAQLSGLEAARRALKNAGKDFANPTEQLAAKRISGGIDGFIAKPPEGGVLAGPAASASKIQKEARANYAAGKRSDRLTGIKDSADLRAAAANSGQNLDNAIRQRAASVLLDPKQRAGFSKGELVLIERVAKGNVGRNTVRAVGNLLGGGGGLGAVVSGAAGGVAGGAIGGPAGVAIGVGAPLLGVAAKKTANRATRKALNTADEAVRMRSPLYRQMPLEPVNQLPAYMGARIPLLTDRAPQFRTQDEYEAYLRGGGA